MTEGTGFAVAGPSVADPDVTEERAGDPAHPEALTKMITAIRDRIERFRANSSHL
jgi:hypothetical protein